MCRSPSEAASTGVVFNSLLQTPGGVDGVLSLVTFECLYQGIGGIVWLIQLSLKCSGLFKCLSGFCTMTLNSECICSLLIKVGGIFQLLSLSAEEGEPTGGTSLSLLCLLGRIVSVRISAGTSSDMPALEVLVDQP